MRIRSIRPEFWASEDVAGMDWATRLVFIGLWSYVDDNGVGRDVERLVVADLFPLEEDPRETLATVSRALARLAEGGQVTRYAVDGKPYLHVTAWDTHQRIDKPGKGRYPLPTCGNAVARETVATVSGGPRETLAPGEGEKGRRGEGSAPSERVADATAPRDAQALVGEWVDHCGDRPPSRVIGHVAKELGLMLGEGIPYVDVRAGLAAWHGRGLHPSALASVVHEHRTQAQRTPRLSRREQEQAATDQMYDRMMARAAEREAADREAS